MPSCRSDYCAPLSFRKDPFHFSQAFFFTSTHSFLIPREQIPSPALTPFPFFSPFMAQKPYRRSRRGPIVFHSRTFLPPPPPPNPSGSRHSISCAVRYPYSRTFFNGIPLLFFLSFHNTPFFFFFLEIRTSKHGISRWCERPPGPFSADSLFFRSLFVASVFLVLLCLARSSSRSRSSSPFVAEDNFTHYHTLAVFFFFPLPIPAKPPMVDFCFSAASEFSFERICIR